LFLPIRQQAHGGKIKVWVFCKKIRDAQVPRVTGVGIGQPVAAEVEYGSEAAILALIEVPLRLSLGVGNWIAEIPVPETGVVSAAVPNRVEHQKPIERDLMA
jgi:hypothetical protein